MLLARFRKCRNRARSSSSTLAAAPSTATPTINIEPDSRKYLLSPLALDVSFDVELRDPDTSSSSSNTRLHSGVLPLPLLPYPSNQPAKHSSAISIPDQRIRSDNHDDVTSVGTKIRHASSSVPEDPRVWSGRVRKGWAENSGEDAEKDEPDFDALIQTSEVSSIPCC